jgi:hypothetical protein
VDTPASVDRDAPVLAHHEIDISAPVSRVWALHQDVNAWPARQSDITAAQLNGAFAPGGSFTWTSFGFTVTSTVYAVQDQSRVLWGGTGDGITGVHEWVFTATPVGTHVETTESFADAPVEADVAGMQRVLDGSLTSWLNHLKNAPRRSDSTGTMAVAGRAWRIRHHAVMSTARLFSRVCTMIVEL